MGRRGTIRLSWTMTAAAGVFLLGLTFHSTLAADAGSRADREALFEFIVEKTLQREAFSPPKNERLNLDFRRDAANLRQAFLEADSDAELYYALVKLSNVRKDRHLTVDLVEGGVDPPRFAFHSPIRFATDYGTPGRYFLFVSDFDRRVAEFTGGVTPEIGDELVSVNGTPIDRHLALMEPYCRYSTLDKLWWELATFVWQKHADFGPELYRDDVTYELRRRDGTVFRLTVPYLPPADVQWAGYSAKRYSGFSEAFATAAYRLYLPTDDRRVILLDWRGFVPSVRNDVDRLVAFAAERDLLDHDVIVDGTSSGGGSQGAYVLQRLSPRAFTTTFGNIKISDVTPKFIELQREELRRQPDVVQRRLVEWLETDVTRAIEERRAYSPTVPFKLAHLPKESNGILASAATHFRGRLVCLLGPSGGSHLDQFAAMVIDNELGHTIGQPTAGHSNTWEWDEVLYFPLSGKPVARFMWSIGHTVRPNREILEGNPAQPKEYFPVTRDNFATYYDQLLAHAMDHLQKTGGAAGREGNGIEP